MKTLSINPAFVTGLDEIDLQHAFFVDLLARLTPALRNSKSLPRQVRLLQEIQLFAAFHFHSEENLYREHGLSDHQLTHHQKRHGELLGALNHYIFQLEQEKETVESILAVLGDWFAFHAVEEDGYAVTTLFSQQAEAESRNQTNMLSLSLQSFDPDDPFG
ncbi:hemerythrin-like metal-binding protein [Magnetococcus marinus MC-1]|uniref:Hemerythrin-like metal-binding protein n=1 Tax=Magnetococcus marinus (strain ATCC BAA-1437 / JCM 17883 / MC-1) TaxID=156889 RepID=A0LD01_MAGMM|nr:hemerythrin family protein [Magnetococcus marinus]ABK45844.1 hemerythrin-like metal-binding protein [Magnetococcus marinus MC-1]